MSCLGYLGNAPGGARSPKVSTEHARRRTILATHLNRLDAPSRDGHFFFVGCRPLRLGPFRVAVAIAAVRRAASGRQRFKSGRWTAGTDNARRHQYDVVNTDTMCELLRTIAAANLVGPITVVLDNARYQRNKVVQGLAVELNIRLLFLPSYSPNLNLIERLWGFAKRQSVYGKYHATFASFRAAIEKTLNEIPTSHADRLKSLMTLRFQQFDDVSLLAA